MKKLKTATVLKTALKLVGGERARTHGDKYINHKNIADLWNGYLSSRIETPLTAQDVTLMMALLKIARTKIGAHNEDNYVDGAAYVAIAGECHDEEIKRSQPKAKK